MYHYAVITCFVDVVLILCAQVLLDKTFVCANLALEALTFVLVGIHRAYFSYLFGASQWKIYNLPS